MLLPLRAMGEYASWEFEEGEEIAPGAGRAEGDRRRQPLRGLPGLGRGALRARRRQGCCGPTRPRTRRRCATSPARSRRSTRWPTRRWSAASTRSSTAPHPHVLIEHLEGPSLRRLIRRDGAIPLEQLLPLAAHVAGALQYMAQAGYVHLDVKPDNIVMGLPPRLIDLSIARTARARRRAPTGPLGTDPYMAARAVRRGRARRGADRPAQPTPGASARRSSTRSPARSRSPRAADEAGRALPAAGRGRRRRCPRGSPTSLCAS